MPTTANRPSRKQNRSVTLASLLDQYLQGYNESIVISARNGTLNVIYDNNYQDSDTPESYSLYSQEHYQDDQSQMKKKGLFGKLVSRMNNYQPSHEQPSDHSHQSNVIRNILNNKNQSENLQESDKYQQKRQMPQQKLKKYDFYFEHNKPNNVEMCESEEINHKVYFDNFLSGQQFQQISIASIKQKQNSGYESKKEEIQIQDKEHSKKQIQMDFSFQEIKMQVQQKKTKNSIPKQKERWVQIILQNPKKELKDQSSNDNKTLINVLPPNQIQNLQRKALEPVKQITSEVNDQIKALVCQKQQQKTLQNILKSKQIRIEGTKPAQSCVYETRQVDQEIKIDFDLNLDFI